jgi:hypothetical protein
MFEQLPPELSQSCHAYVNEVGLPFHDPFDVDNVLPWDAEPETTGSAEFDGAAPPAPEAAPPEDDATIAVGAEPAVADPLEFDAVTIALIVWPTSPAPSE